MSIGISGSTPSTDTSFCLPQDGRPTQHQADCLIDLVERSILYRAPGNKNNIPPCSYLVLLQPLPHRLPHPALYSIPRHGLSDPPPDGKAEAAVFQIVALSREHQ
jgi:hypothetical protein